MEHLNLNQAREEATIYNALLSQELISRECNLPTDQAIKECFE